MMIYSGYHHVKRYYTMFYIIIPNGSEARKGSRFSFEKEVETVLSKRPHGGSLYDQPSSPGDGGEKEKWVVNLVDRKLTADCSRSPCRSELLTFHLFQFSGVRPGLNLTIARCSFSTLYGNQRRLLA